MACSNFEVAIMEHLENQLPQAQRAEVAKHLATCAECQAFAKELQDLDAVFSRQIKRPTLSADFNARLARRIQLERMAMSEAERAERKRQFEMEFKSGMKALQRSLWAVLFLDGLGLGVIGGLAGWLFWGFSKGFITLNHAHSTMLLGSTASVCLALAAMGLLTQPVRRYLKVI